MPNAFLYLGLMLAVILIWFTALKRPIYEAVLLSFVVLLAVTGKWVNIPHYLEEALSSSLIYSMTAFVAMSLLLTKTKVIDSCISLILALVGRIPGGPGYAAVISSAFMGSLSGSGPGNVMATGSITIPSMIRAGFPRELAANIESNASYLGNMIPPSSNIVAALGAFTAMYPALNISAARFWVVLWGISLYFILQRLLMVFAFCKYYKVKPLPKDRLPGIRETLKTGWQGFLLPFIILLPFVADFLWKDTFFTARLGAAGAKALSSGTLLFVAGIAALYACLVAKDKKTATPHALAKLFGGAVKSIAPAIGVCIFGYMIGALFADLNVSQELEAVLSGLPFGKLGVVLVICVITCFMGMVIPGSSQVVLFGPMFIALLAGAGVDPLLAAAMLPCICGVMCGITPPLALGMYAGMSIAGSDFSKTVKNDLWWVAAQFVLQVAVLMGWLPILGL